MKELTDTEMLDWLIDHFLENQDDVYTMRLAAALMLGKTGRDLVKTAMEASA